MTSLIKWLPLVIINAIIIIYVNFHSSAVHFPLLVSMALSMILGWVQPYKGWILAIGQVIFIAGLYFFVKESGILPIENKDIAEYVTLSSILTTFSGSLIGGMFKRNL